MSENDEAPAERNEGRRALRCVRGGVLAIGVVACGRDGRGDVDALVDGGVEAAAVEAPPPPDAPYAGPPPCASPDELNDLGGTVVYEGDPVDGPDPDVGFEVFVIGAPDWETKLLASSPEFDGHPSWSPDGSRVVYQSNASGSADLFLIDPDGAARTPLLETADEEGYPKWLPEGIFYRRNEVFWLFDTETQTQRLADLPPDIRGFAFSPDRSRTVVTSGPLFNIHIYSVGPDGTLGEQLTDECPVELHPIWDPTGTRIAYACGDGMRDGEWDVRILDVDSGENVQVTTRPGADSPEAWAAGGQWLLIASGYGDNGDVYAIRPDGSSRMRVTCHAGHARYSRWTAAE